MGRNSLFRLISLFTCFMKIILANDDVNSAVPAKEVSNSCIECKSQPCFHVTDKKLFKYYRDWELWIHFHEGATCFDCHRGIR
jgi:hypothetical protein